MKKLFLLLVIAALLFTACEEHGTKININNKSEVFYKGDGVNEADAKRLGAFLLKQGYFSTIDNRSVQLLKEGDVYIVKFVVDEERLKNDKENVLLGFKVWQMWIQDGVFNGAKTKIVLADNNLEDLHPVPEFTAQEKSEMSTPN